MTYVELLTLAQQTAASAQSAKATAFGVAKAAVAAFTSSSNPDSDWPIFSANLAREGQAFAAAAQKDAAPVAGPAVAGPAPSAAQVIAGLPQAVQDRIATANRNRAAMFAPKAAVVAPVAASPAPVVAAPAAVAAVAAPEEVPPALPSMAPT